MQITLIALMSNAALLLFLSVIYQLTNLINTRYTRFKQIVNGLLIALTCIAIMSIPFGLYHGVVFDTRSILISVTALLFGPISTIITLVAASVFRILQGGAGACILKDITSQKKAETDLQLSESEYHQLYETMAQGVVYQAADGMILSANPAAEKILGLRLDKMMRMSSCLRLIVHTVLLLLQ